MERLVAERAVETLARPGLTERSVTAQVLATDFSAEAIRILRGRGEYAAQLGGPRRLHAFVGDVSAPTGEGAWAWVEALAAAVGGLHFVTMVFVLSALEGDEIPRAVARASSLLRPGGLAFFRDYGAGDLAQRRLEAKGQTDGAGRYERGEGTLARYRCRAENRRSPPPRTIHVAAAAPPRKNASTSQVLLFRRSDGPLRRLYRGRRALRRARHHEPQAGAEPARGSNFFAAAAAKVLAAAAAPPRPRSPPRRP